MVRASCGRARPAPPPAARGRGGENAEAALSSARYNWTGPRTEGALCAPAWDEVVGTELYDHADDDGEDFDCCENANLAADPDLAETVAELRGVLRDLFNSTAFGPCPDDP